MTPPELENPVAYYPNIPGYLVPLFQSQARQEACVEHTKKEVEALKQKQEALPCSDHAEATARLQERVKNLEEGQHTREQEKVLKNAYLAALAANPKLTATGIGTTIGGIILWLWQTGAFGG